MMLSASPSMIVRSSLEEMLDSLRRRDEDEKPKDLPPALPPRPTSKGRLPPARRSLPTDFKVGDENRAPECLPNGVEETKRKDSECCSRRNGFGGKKMRKDGNGEPSESPYAASQDEINTGFKERSDRAAGAETDGDDSIGYFIKKKLRVWCRLSNGQWETGTIQSTSGEYAFVALPKGHVMKIASSELLPANPSILDGADDLIHLSYLNEPSLLSNLQYRYSKDMIYTKAGSVLIALNPFKDGQIYGDDFVTAYRQKRSNNHHVFAVADTAYDSMMRDEVNQSIIISGESGAGKTVTAKITLQYLTALHGGSSGIEKKILQSNYILEAFGTSKTSKNNNSSRFGKLIELHFSTLGKISGGNIQAYLLDKSRVVQVANGERSYDIFYQLCAGAPKNLIERLNLRAASDYKYLSQSDCIATNGVNEAQKFHILMESLDVVRISKEEQEHVFSMLAAILWMGNISFQVIDNSNQVEVLADEAVTSAAKLMGCSTQELIRSLCRCKTESGEENTVKKWTLQQAIDRRDALVKFIYASLFDWLVERINNSLQVGVGQIQGSISIIDMCGFESIQTNGFEQMFVNYANERLQQHFNRHLLKLEQEDYELDGIDWTKLDFEDNHECLDLFEKRSSGLISVLDEESNLVKASDLTFANKLKHHLNSNSCFKGERGRAFSVRHRSEEVLYDTNGFLEKNKDTLHFDFLELLSSCTNKLLQLLASKVEVHSQKPAGTLCQNSLSFPSQSASTALKLQLFELMHQLESTRPHFICCVKPNDKQLPGIYQADLISRQIRVFNVLEVVRISRLGYPTRMKHQEFARRYGSLVSKTGVSQDPLSVSIAVLQQFSIPPEMYQIGYTKVFLRSGQIEALERRRRTFLEGVIAVQKYVRGYQARRLMYKLKKGFSTVQLGVPREINRGKNSIVAKWRLANASKTPDELQAVVYLQSVIRGSLVRRQLNGTHPLKKLRPESENYKKVHGRRMSDGKEQVHAIPPSLEELQERVVKAEETVVQRDEENAALREQLQKVEARWLEYEVKMKSMEETWQKQMTSLQMSLAAARKSIADAPTGQPGRSDAVMSPRYYDSDATSMGSRTPGASTPLKYSANGGLPRDTNGTLNAVSTLIKEFEQQRQTFDDDARAIVNVHPGFPPPNSDSELRKLRLRFETWKKEYKVRLREAKAKVQTFGQAGAERSRRKWWGRIGAKAS